MKKNRITAAIAALTMATTAFASTAMSASAQETTVTGSFYAFYDHDDNSSTPDQWAPAPYGMDDGNIAAVADNGDGTYTLTLQDATFNIPVIGNKTGYISELTYGGSSVLSGTNGSGHPAYANNIVATDISNWTTSDFQDDSLGTQYDMTAKVKMGILNWEVQHNEEGIIFVLN